MTGSFVRDADYGTVYSKTTATSGSADTGDDVEFVGYGNRVYQLRVSAGAVTTGAGTFTLQQSADGSTNWETIETVALPVASATVYQADVRVTKPYVRGVLDPGAAGSIASCTARLEDVHYLRSPVRAVPEFEPPDPD